MSDDKPEPLTLTIVIECEDGKYYANIAGSHIYGDGKTPAGAVASVAEALRVHERYQTEFVLRRFAVAKNEARRREKIREAVGDKVDALASKLESNLDSSTRPSDLPETDFGNIESVREK